MSDIRQLIFPAFNPPERVLSHKVQYNERTNTFMVWDDNNTVTICTPSEKEWVECGVLTQD